MIKIEKLTGEIMELDANGAIPVERNNSLFNEDTELLMDVSYPGKAPLTPSNKIFFARGHRVESKNEVYQFEVSVSINSKHLFSGILRYQFKEGYYDFTVKPNFAAIAQKAKDFGFRDVRFNDRMVLSSGGAAELEDFMKLTAENPQDYPAVFFPVLNLYMIEPQDPPIYDFGYVNRWQDGKFVTQFPPHVDIAYVHFESPYFRLNYILERVCEFLGFKVEGSILTDPEMMKKCIYTRITNYNLPRTNRIVWENSNIYMPDMKMSEFLMAVKERYALVFDFDYATKVVTIDTLDYCLNHSPIHDISDYVSEVKEIGTNDQKGYSLYLKTDPDDQLFDVAVDENQTISVPTNILKIGKPVDKDHGINIGTLKNRKNIFDESVDDPYVEAKQLALDTTLSTRKIYFNPTGGGRPDRGTQDVYRPKESYEASISDNGRSAFRVVNYEGFNNIGTNDFFPESSPDELGKKDILKYSYLNGSKRVKCMATLPNGLLSRIKIRDRVSFKSKEGFYCEYLIQQKNYDLVDGSRTPVEFVLRTKSYEPSETAILPGISLDENDSFATSAISAYFPHLDSISFEIWVTYTPSGGSPITEKFSEHTLIKSTDIYGAGGHIININIPKEKVISSRGRFRIRFYGERPLYKISPTGETTLFTHTTQYDEMLTSGDIFVAFESVN